MKYNTGWRDTLKRPKNLQSQTLEFRYQNHLQGEGGSVCNSRLASVGQSKTLDLK